MSYKTILVHLEHALSMRKSLDVAIRLAEQEDAHLIGVATTGISSYAYSEHSALFDKAIQTLTERAKQLLDDFDRVCRLANVCLLYTSPSPRDLSTSRMPSSA